MFYRSLNVIRYKAEENNISLHQNSMTKHRRYQPNTVFQVARQTSNSSIRVPGLNRVPHPPPSSPPPRQHQRFFDSSRTKSLSRNALTQKGSLSFDRYGDQTATGTAGPLRTELNGTFLSTLSNKLVNTYEISPVLRISLLGQKTRKRLESSVLVHPGLLQ